MTRKEFASIVALLEAAYEKEISKESADVYFAMLQGIDEQFFKAAVELHIKQSRFFPRISELVENAKELSDRYEGLRKLSAGEAWGEVRSGMRRFGARNTPGEEDWSDPLIQNAVHACGGWQYLCLSENPVPDRARFFEIWKSLESKRTTVRLLQEVERKFFPEVEASMQLTEGEKRHRR